MSKLYIHIAIHKTWFSSWKLRVHERILRQSFEKSSLQKIKVMARWEAFVQARRAPCWRDPILWVCLERLNPKPHLYPFADIDSPPGLLLRHLWNIDKKSYFQNPKAQDMARVTQCSTFSPHIWELLSLSITSSEKILTTWKASAWPGLLGPMYI